MNMALTIDATVYSRPLAWDFCTQAHKKVINFKNATNKGSLER